MSTGCVKCWVLAFLSGFAIACDSLCFGRVKSSFRSSSQRLWWCNRLIHLCCIHNSVTNVWLMCPNSALLHSKLNTFSSFFKAVPSQHKDCQLFFFLFLFFCHVVKAGCSPGHWSGWGECRIIGAMLDLVSVALQCWGSGTWKHWLNSYQSFQTPSWRKASWASFLSGPRPVEVQRDGEACRPACVCVRLCVRTAFERE